MKNNQTKNRILFALILVLALSSDSFALNGSGTQADPYRIEDLAGFDAFASDPNYWAADVYTHLDCDPNLAGRTYTNAVIAPADIDSIEWSFNGIPYAGVFEAAGHTIKNLKIIQFTRCYIGLFGATSATSQIKNLTISNVYLEGNQYVGVVAAFNSGSISNCHTQAYIQSDYGYAGGIAGESEGLISNSTSSSTVNGCVDLGGLVGWNDGDISNCHTSGEVRINIQNGGATGGLVGRNSSGTISDCSSSSNVYGSGANDSSGGLVGANADVIERCFATGSVSLANYTGGGLVGYNSYGDIYDSYATGNVSGDFYLGGFVGWNKGGDIIGCFSTGNVLGQKDLGGLIGLSTSYNVTNCYSSGDVEGIESVGGLCGSTGSNNTITNCYSKGKVTGTLKTGGLIGDKYNGFVVKSFWDITVNPTLNGLGDADDPNVIAETTVNMQTSSTFANAGWDLTTPIWRVYDGHEYPRLDWEINKYSGGSGTQADPYRLSINADWLELIAGTGDWSSHFVLTQDIDVTGVALVPIGDYDSRFEGALDGNNFTIRNVTINLPTVDYVALFGYATQTSSFKDITLENVNVVGNNHVGTLIGFNYGTIENVHSSGFVTGYSSVGGIMGTSNWGGIINCTTDVTINLDSWYGGGICGYNATTNLFNCHADGDVIGTASSGELGGLVGALRSSNAVNCSASGDVNGYQRIGGLAGMLDWYLIRSCYASGNVTAYKDSGGLVGRNLGIMENSYCSGDVNVTSGGGGLIGADWSGEGHVLNCMATGTVTGTDKIGGIAGTSYGNTLYLGMNYFDTDKNPSLPGISDYTDPNIAGKTTAKLYDRQTFVSSGWDFIGEDENGFKDFWRLCSDGETYPKLSWEYQGDFECPDGVDIEDLSYFADKWLMTDRYGFVFADINADGVVDTDDLLILSNNWLEHLCYDCGADFDRDYNVNFLEFSIFSKHWLQYDFSRADLNNDGDVTLADFAMFAGDWMNVIASALDVNPPLPDPMTWEMPPHITVGISSDFAVMVATTAVDPEGNAVEYYFECIDDPSLSSGWQLNNDYEVDVVAGQTYSFRLKARDTSPQLNETQWSTTGNAL